MAPRRIVATLAVTLVAVFGVAEGVSAQLVDKLTKGSCYCQVEQNGVLGEQVYNGAFYDDCQNVVTVIDKFNVNETTTKVNSCFFLPSEGSHIDGACKCNTSCYKFGQKMGGSVTGYTAGPNYCFLQGCEEYSTYDACVASTGESGGTAANSKTGTDAKTVEFFSADLKSDIKGLDKVNTSAAGLIGRFIKILMGVIGTIALVMFVYGGLMWMTAGGNSDREGKAMGTIVWSSLGIIVILASYALADLVFEAFR